MTHPMKTNKLYKIENGDYVFAGFLNLDYFAMARSLAVEHHGDQMYGGYPYVWHLDDVVASLKTDVLVHKDDKPTLIVGMLHDILEDCSTITKDVIARLFNQDIADDVVALTKVRGETPDDYLQRVCSRRRSWLVKVHDTLCNLKESVRNHQVVRINKYTNQLSMLYAHGWMHWKTS